VPLIRELSSSPNSDQK